MFAYVKRVVMALLVLSALCSVSALAEIHVIEISNFQFSPQKTAIAPGDTVRWVLVSGVHTSTSDASSPKAWDSGTMDTPGQEFDAVFEPSDGLGPFPYHCTFHAQTMKDTIFVSVPSVTINIFGLDNSSLGLASLGRSGDSLKISNIGSSGNDGVSVDVGQAEGIGPVRWMAPESIGTKSYSTMTFTGSQNGMGNFMLGTISTSWDDSVGTIDLDFSPQGITTYSVEVRSSGNPIYQSSGQSGSNVLYESAGKAPAVNDPFDGFTKISSIKSTTPNILHFNSPVSIDLNDGAGPHTGNSLVFIPQEGSTDFDFLSQVDLTFIDRDTIRIIKEGLYLFGGQSFIGIGQASFSATESSLTVGNIGSSGEDGFQMGFDSSETVKLDWQDLPAPNGQPETAGLSLAVFGSMNGSPDQQLAQIDVNNGDNPDLRGTTFDYSGIGSATQDMQVFLDNTEVSSVSGISNASKARHDIAMNSIRNMKGSIISIAIWDSPTMITLPGQSPVMGDSLVVTSVAPANTVDYLSDVVLTAVELGSIAITGVSTTFDYLCGDANDDTKVNVSDAVYIINYVFVGGPAPDPLVAADGNCDTKVNVSDAVYLINYVFTGGNNPCDPNGDLIPDC